MGIFFKARDQNCYRRMQDAPPQTYSAVEVDRAPDLDGLWYVIVEYNKSKKHDVNNCQLRFLCEGIAVIAAEGATVVTTVLLLISHLASSIRKTFG